MAYKIWYKCKHGKNVNISSEKLIEPDENVVLLLNMSDLYSQTIFITVSGLFRQFIMKTDGPDTNGNYEWPVRLS